MKHWIALLLVVTFACSAALASEQDLQAQIEALQNKVAELEAQQKQVSVEQRNTQLLQDMLRQADMAPRQQAQDSAINAGYDRGFFIKTADDQFALKINTRLQVRHTYHNYDDCGSSAFDNTSASNVELERARLYFKGHVFGDWNYRIQIDGDDDSTDNSVLVQEYELNHMFMPEFGIKIGRYKGAFGRQENASSGRQMMVDRSLANEVFNINRNSGLEVIGGIQSDQLPLSYRIGIYNGFRDEKERPLRDYDNNVAVAARLMLPLLGATLKDFSDESDLQIHENPVIMFGTSFAYNDAQNENTPAGGDEDNYDVLVRSIAGEPFQVDGYGPIYMLGADAAFKYMGLSVILEGFYQNTDLDDTFINPADLALIDGLEVDNYGFYAQCGYFLVPQTFELTSRIGGVCVDSAGTTMEYAGGWNYYIYGQDLKLSMDVTYVDDMLPISESSSNYVGIADEALLMVRTQLQFQF